VLPDSVFYGRHLLREGDFITSVNGQSVEQLLSSDCDELLLAPRSAVVRIELLRSIDPGSADDGRTGPGWETVVTQDGRLGSDGVPTPLRRRSLPDELNRNQLFARSKLRMSCRSGSDRESPRDFAGEEDGGTVSSRPAADGFFPSGRDPVCNDVDGSARFQCVEENSSKSELPGHESVYFDHDPLVAFCVCVY